MISTTFKKSSQYQHTIAVKFLTILVVVLTRCCHSLQTPMNDPSSSSGEDNNMATAAVDDITTTYSQNKQQQQNLRRLSHSHEIEETKTKGSINYEVTIHEITSSKDTKVKDENDSRRHLQSSSFDRIVFYVMGDGPYEDRERQFLLPDQLQKIDRRAEFMVHVGDIQERRSTCSAWRLESAAQTMQTHLAIPTFVIPGDNDWIECSNFNSQWDTWKETFLFFHQQWSKSNNNNHNFAEVVHQNGRDENFAFVVRDETLFVGVHVLRADIPSNARQLWADKDVDNANWISTQFDTYGSQVSTAVIFAHAYPEPNRYPNVYNALQKVAQNFDNKPILYIQGDTHKFIVDHKFPFAKNILRLVVDRQGTWDPTEVSVYPNAEVPFKFKRRIDRRYENSE